jgi:hypothetical protein
VGFEERDHRPNGLEVQLVAAVPHRRGGRHDERPMPK